MLITRRGALSAALDYRPDLILLDAMMPKISGFDVLDILVTPLETMNLRRSCAHRLSQDKDRQRAESLGVDDYLVKSQVVIYGAGSWRNHLGMDI